ncbi:putative wd repeat protein [Golovinomyces cichoracearum]|uniref:Putative wd repeat protein n=1 Tax=Golovinomyces cichoracearum TaxID=62708 RepID=A0A420HQL5_9PEZI|nr:putative wd repeat protein [Golovinomyces cichoracearum]
MRLLGQSAVNTTACEEVCIDLNRRLSSSHSLAYCAGKELFCMDKSPDKQRIVIAGSGVFKILKVGEAAITEEIDLRAIIWIHATSHNTATRSSEISNTLAIVAVKWSHGAFSSLIFTASANGVITAYDLNKTSEGLEIARIQAHEREIYKITISPHKPQWILTASRDGSVKSWNFRINEISNDAYFQQWRTFKSTSEVLDVEWSPTDGLAFACSTELGQILTWDLRNPTKPSLRINAHVGQCYSIAWHPDGDHIASGGQDKFCHVWAITKNGKNSKKALHTLETRAPISCVLWRPALWSATAHSRRAAQITITYKDDRKMDSLVEIWDLARPTMPFKQLPYKPKTTQKMNDTQAGLKYTRDNNLFGDQGWDTAPIGIIWNNRDMLWTINNTIGTTNSGQSTVREGYLIQSNISFVPNTIEQRSLSNLAFSPTGDILMILEQRQAIRQRRPTLETPEISPEFPQSPSPISCQSFSDSEEEIIGNFLGTPKKRLHKKNNATQSDISPMNRNLMTLEASIELTGIYKPQQVMAIGHAPSTINRSEYQYYCNYYLTRLLDAPRVAMLPDEQITSILEDFAKNAGALGHYTIAQTWRVLRLSMGSLLTRRAQYHRDLRPKYQETTILVKEESKESKKSSANSIERCNDRSVWSRLQPDITLRSRKSNDILKDSVSEEVESISNFINYSARFVNDFVGYRADSVASLSQTKDGRLSLLDTDTAANSSSLLVPNINLEKSRIDPFEAEGSSLLSDDLNSPLENEPTSRVNCDDISEILILPSPSQDPGQFSQSFFSSKDQDEDYFMQETKIKSSPDENYFITSSATVPDFEKQSSIDFRGQEKIYAAVKRSPEGRTSELSKEENRTPATLNSFPSIHNQQISIVGNDRKKATSLATLSQPVTTKSFPTNSYLFTPEDFLYKNDDPLFTIPALDPSNIIQRLVVYHTSTTSTPYHIIPIILLLLPYLSPGTINCLHASHIISEVHERLKFLELYNEATLLRNLCVPNYPEIYAESQQNIRVSFFCRACNKPFDPDPCIFNSHWMCSRCESTMFPCPICEQREYIPEEPEFDLLVGSESMSFMEGDINLSLGTWWYCPGCAHGGHATCILKWHAASEPGDELGSLHSGGACPVVGCLHPCLARV